MVIVYEYICGCGCACVCVYDGKDKLKKGYDVGKSVRGMGNVLERREHIGDQGQIRKILGWELSG